MTKDKKQDKQERSNMVDIKELLSRDTSNVKVIEVNKPNYERAARAFYELLYKK